MSTPGKLFAMTPEHITLLRHANVQWEDCEAGAPAIDCKRPYGNSDVEGDVARLLGWTVDERAGPTPEQEDRAMRLHRETETALQIILATGDMTPGTFVLAERYDYLSWRRVAESALFAG